ncbi:MAG: GGDEF domain-containing protein, partial [Bulleidia sp.]
KTKQHRMRVILECILYPFAGAVTSLFIYYVPFIILGILPSIIKVLIEMQNENIYTDALTGINNRYRVNEFLERSWDKCSVSAPMVIYLIDLNKFKTINDHYGHLEGDRALVAVADALKKVASEGLVIGRFGGDEFILADPRNHDPEKIKQELRDVLEENVRNQKFPFSLTISIGYARCTDPSISITEVQKLADERLYEDKKAQEMLRQQTFLHE